MRVYFNDMSSGNRVLITEKTFRGQREVRQWACQLKSKPIQNTDTCLYKCVVEQFQIYQQSRDLLFITNNMNK